METQGEDDRKLLEMYRESGNPSAIDALVAKYGNGLLAYLIASTRSKTDAEEIFQETWFKVMKNSTGFHGGSFKAWITTIARRTMIDRSRKKTPFLVLDESNENGTTFLDSLQDHSGRHPGASLESGEVLVRIRKAVLSLPEEQKEVFLLRTQEDLSFAEIAKLLSIPLNTALGRMHYAVVKLRKELLER